MPPLPNKKEVNVKKTIFYGLVTLVFIILLFPGVVLANDGEGDTKVEVVVVGDGAVTANIDLQSDNLNVNVNGKGLVDQTQLNQVGSGLTDYIYTCASALEESLKSLRTQLESTQNDQASHLTLHDDAIAKLILVVESQLNSLRQLNGLILNMGSDDLARANDLSRQISESLDLISQLTAEDNAIRQEFNQQIEAAQQASSDQLEQAKNNFRTVLIAASVAVLVVSVGISWLVSWFLVPR